MIFFMLIYTTFLCAIGMNIVHLDVLLPFLIIEHESRDMLIVRDLFKQQSLTFIDMRDYLMYDPCSC